MNSVSKCREGERGRAAKVAGVSAAAGNCTHLRRKVHGPLDVALAVAGLELPTTARAHALLHRVVGRVVRPWSRLLSRTPPPHLHVACARARAEAPTPRSRRLRREPHASRGARLCLKVPWSRFPRRAIHQALKIALRFRPKAGRTHALAFAAAVSAATIAAATATTAATATGGGATADLLGGGGAADRRQRKARGGGALLGARALLRTSFTPPLHGKGVTHGDKLAERALPCHNAPRVKPLFLPSCEWNHVPQLATFRLVVLSAVCRTLTQKKQLAKVQVSTQIFNRAH